MPHIFPVNICKTLALIIKLRQLPDFTNCVLTLALIMFFGHSKPSMFFGSLHHDDSLYKYGVTHSDKPNIHTTLFFL